MKMKNASLGINRGQVKRDHLKRHGEALLSHEEKGELRTGAPFFVAVHILPKVGISH